MSGERWRASATGAPPDPRRRELFDEWCASGVVEFDPRVTFEEYARRRLDGTWNEYAREHLRGRFVVEGPE